MVIYHSSFSNALKLILAGTPFPFTASRWTLHSDRHPQLLRACRNVLVLPVHVALPRREGAALDQEEFDFPPTGKTYRLHILAPVPCSISELRVVHCFYLCKHDQIRIAHSCDGR